MMRTPLYSFIAMLCGLFVCAGQRTAVGDVEYAAHRVLARNCYACHGPDASTREAGLRLDRRELAVVAADSGAIPIVSGRPDESEVIARVFADDEDVRMPPADSHKKLSDAEKDLLRKWIETGAGFPMHWAYAPLARPPVPNDVAGDPWVQTPIDAFVLYQLRRHQLQPAVSARPAQLLRRLSFGLTGLPPDPAVAEQYADGISPADWQSLVEGLLGSRQYAEHWANHWMDVVRYADSSGYSTDYIYTNAWQYRDWIIRSFESNKPFDRFIQEQIAGDQLWPDSEDAKTGAMYLLVGRRKAPEKNTTAAEIRDEYLTELTETTSAAFLASTFECARCHDHKFDPLAQDDYFGLQAIFADSRPKVDRKGGFGGQNVNPAVLAVNRLAEPATVHVLRRGELSMPRGEAQPRLPSAFQADVAFDDPSRRAVLAKWLTARDNPLTARVLANRVWNWHFGQPLVDPPNDFGLQTQAPEHLDLLNLLAVELIENDWDLRHLHRMILNSAVYQMSTSADEETMAHDPDGRLLSRFPRRRLTAEEFRDTLLAVSDRLNSKSFGPSVIPAIEKWEANSVKYRSWGDPSPRDEQNRRSVYLLTKRFLIPSFLKSFQRPDRDFCTGRRETAVTPQQALVMLNSRDALAHARHLAAMLWQESGSDIDKAVDTAWWRLFTRRADDAERELTIKFIDERVAYWNGKSIDRTLSSDAIDAPQPIQAAWTEWALALINTNEVFYVN